MPLVSSDVEHVPHLPHDGAALAADETDHGHHRPPGLASIHTRAAITWLAIFPLAAIGMTAMTALVPTWLPALKALVLTAVVVPLSVYILVPRLLVLRLWLLSRRASPRTSGHARPVATQKEA